MEDFTGGVTESFDTSKPPEKFYKLLLKAQERQSLMCCSIEAKPNEIEAKLNNGLIKGHAYTLTAIQKVCYTFCILCTIFHFMCIFLFYVY